MTCLRKWKEVEYIMIAVVYKQEYKNTVFIHVVSYKIWIKRTVSDKIAIAKIGIRKFHYKLSKLWEIE